ncbi:MAG: hypothetical protein C4325_05000 [Blastocatellia bacterium]
MRQRHFFGLRFIRPREQIDLVSSDVLGSTKRYSIRLPIRNALPNRSKFLIDNGDGIYFENMDRGWMVYGRSSEKCFRCKKLMSSIRQSGRTTFYCPGCQRR